MAQSTDFWSKLTKYTKSTPDRLNSMVEALYAIEDDSVPGDVVECGVWRGGNIMLARLIAPERVCWLFDTFEGMTVPDPELDVKRDGEKAIDRYKLKLAGGTKWDAASFEEVIKGFQDLGLYDASLLRFIGGPVEDTLPGAVIRAPEMIPTKISILRLDMDWYSPTKVALDYLYPRLSVNGFLIVDDYGHWMGCKKAVDEYFNEDVPVFKDIDYSCRVFRKG